MVLRKNQTFSLSSRKTGKEPDPLVVVKKNFDRKIVSASNVSPFLFKAKGTWPFDFIPDELIVEEKRLVIKRKYFPFFTVVTTIPLSRVTVFELTDSLFFSGIRIKASYGDGVDTVFQWLSHSSALKLKSVVEGLRLKETESVELMDQDRVTRLKTLQLIGSY